jgi:hypothetical protein
VFIHLPLVACCISDMVQKWVQIHVSIVGCVEHKQTKDYSVICILYAQNSIVLSSDQFDPHKTSCKWYRTVCIYHFYHIPGPVAYMVSRVCMAFKFLIILKVYYYIVLTRDMISALVGTE